MSKKRARANREYSVRRKAYLAAHPFCEAHESIAHFLRWPIGIPIPQATEIHHMKKPKCKYLNDEGTWLAVSAWAHRWIEDNKSIARRLALLE